MGANARLYEVAGPRGTVYVYALHDPDTGMIWTERSEKCARDLAAEKKLTIVHQSTISREDLLRLMGQEPVNEEPLRPPGSPPAAAASPTAMPHRPAASATTSTTGSAWESCKVVVPPRPSSSSLKIEYVEDEEDAIVARAPTPPRSIFNSKAPPVLHSADEPPANPDESDVPLARPAKTPSPNLFSRDTLPTADKDEI